MVQVFISHSKKDEDLIRITDLNFKSAGISPLFMEFTPESEPPFKKIEKNIATSDAVFLFLTENLKSSDFTQNWVAFEVGLTRRSNKPLFVVEDINNRVHFPVPYLTDYILYEPTKIEDWQNIQKILQKMKQAIENNNLRMGLTAGGAVLGGLLSSKDRIGGALVGGFTGLVIGGILMALKEAASVDSIKTKCPKCGITFNLYSRFRSFTCPSCRMELRFG